MFYSLPKLQAYFAEYLLLCTQITELQAYYAKYLPSLCLNFRPILSIFLPCQQFAGLHKVTIDDITTVTIETSNDITIYSLAHCCTISILRSPIVQANYLVLLNSCSLSKYNSHYFFKPHVYSQNPRSVLLLSKFYKEHKVQKISLSTACKDILTTKS